MGAGVQETFTILFRPTLFLRRLVPDQERAELAHVEARIGLAGAREGRAAVAHGALEQPPHGRLQLVARPDPVDLALLGLAGGVAAAAHGRDVRLACRDRPR